MFDSRRIIGPERERERARAREGEGGRERRFSGGLKIFHYIDLRNIRSS
jgi:hypothetical protein